MCKCSPCCQHALNEATLRWPSRRRDSDGCCASPEHHKQNPDSDHEPDASGYAHAFDLSHDPASGCDVGKLAATLSEHPDPRVKYVIFNGRIWKARTGHWEEYRGTNPHQKHMHVSIYPTETFNFDSWPWAGPSEPKTLQQGDRGEAVKDLQTKLVAKGFALVTDGVFGPATQAALTRFQKRAGLAAIGVADKATLEALNK